MRQEPSSLNEGEEKSRLRIESRGEKQLWSTPAAPKRLIMRRVDETDTVEELEQVEESRATSASPSGMI